jgi:hypothetical protein
MASALQRRSARDKNGAAREHGESLEFMVIKTHKKHMDTHYYYYYYYCYCYYYYYYHAL